MYNGIGLSTPRGSGSSGHVQKNHAALQKKHKFEHREETKSELISRPPNKEILEHTRKREIEVKCLELSDTLEEQGYSEAEVEFKVKSYRKILVENYEKMYKSKKNDELHQPDELRDTLDSTKRNEENVSSDEDLKESEQKKIKR